MTGTGEPNDHRIADAGTLMAQARSQAGIELHDEDAAEPLAHLVRAFNDEARLHESGARRMRGWILRILENRLRMKRDFLAHPEIADEEIRTPVFICGMPRTGSTKAQKLLAASGDFNWLPFWKVAYPSLITGDRAETVQYRIDRTEEIARWFAEAVPENATAHPLETLEPEEDCFLVEHSLRCYIFNAWGKVDGYNAWLAGQDPLEGFHHLKNSLKYLQWQGLADRSKPWVLKSPIYSGREAELQAVFPNARFAMTHRHPASSVPSGVRLLRGYRKPFSAIQPRGEDVLRNHARTSIAHLANRAAMPGGTFLDIDFRKLTADGTAAMLKVYDHACLVPGPYAVSNMRSWEASNPQHKGGRPSDSLEQYGLDMNQVEAAFSAYMALFRSVTGGSGTLPSPIISTL